MIRASTILTPGPPVEFPSPRSRQAVGGLVKSDQGTYAIVEWEEDGARYSTCMHKGEITCPALQDAPAPPPSAPKVAQPLLFDLDMPAEASPAAAPPTPPPAQPAKAAAQAPAAASAPKPRP